VHENAAVTHVHVVYAHPSGQSFTRAVLDAFLVALREAGHTTTVSDLYEDGFRPELTLEEYERESGRRPGTPLAAEVAVEHARLEAADAWVFVHPLWWNDCPAILKGWFDRVWTVGGAYKPVRLHARRALVLCTSGYTVAELDASGCHQALRTTMLTDRIGARAAQSELVVLGGTATSAGGPERERLAAGHLARVAVLARSL
jgi:NAD(P)H dehydrogenase (quinone)